jgi:hypothetical protein
MGRRWRRSAVRPGSVRRPTSIGRSVATGMSRSGGRVVCSCSTHPPTTTSPVAPDRLASNTDQRDLPDAGALRRPLAERDAAAQAARGRELKAAEGGGRSEPRQRDAAGRAPPKALKPVRKRKLVDELRGDWDVSIRRACRVFLLDTSTYHYKSRRPGQAALEQRIKEICQTRVRYGYRLFAGLFTTVQRRKVSRLSTSGNASESAVNSQRSHGAFTMAHNVDISHNPAHTYDVPSTRSAGAKPLTAFNQISHVTGALDHGFSRASPSRSKA